MKRYPFSKKAMSIMLATALVVTPAATLGPIGGVTVVQAATVDEKINELASRLIVFYQDADANTLKAANDRITNFTISSYPSNVQDIPAKEAAFLNLIKATGTLVYTKHENANALAQAVKDFRTNQSGNFQTLFNGAVTTDDMIEFFAAMESQLNSPEFITTLLGGTYQDAIQGAVTATRDANGGQFTNLDGVLVDNLGTDLAGLFAYDASFNAHVDSNGNARSEILQSAFSQRTIFNVSGTKNPNNEQTINFSASYQNLNIGLENVVTWRVTRNGSPITVTGNKFTPDQAGTYVVTAHLNNEPNLRIAQANVIIESPGGGGGAAPAPTPTPETPTVPERPGQSTDATNTTTVEREQTTTGQTKAVTIVNGGSLASVIAANPNADRIGFTLERAEGEVAELRLPKAAIEALLGSTNTNLVIDINSADGSVSIPLSELAEEKLRAALGLSDNEADFEVSITIAPASSTVTAEVNERLESDTRDLQARSNVIDFSMTVRSGDREVAITNFDSYVFREIPLSNVSSSELSASNVINPENLVVYQVDGEPVAVPTQAETVRFASRTFGKFVVVEREPLTFSDLANTHWAKGSIDRLTIRDVIVGFADGEVKPSRATTRAEFAAMLTRSLALTEAGNYDGRFSDVQGNEWYVEFLIPAVEAGLLEGRANGTFGANDPITRQEAAAVVSRALSFLKISADALDTNKSVGSFTDVANIAPWAEQDVKRAVQAGIMEGHANGRFEARGDTQRAQVAAMIERLLKKGSLL